MTIILDGSEGGLPPLKPRKEPLVRVSGVVAVDDVQMMARDEPMREYRRFYEDILGFAVDAPGEADFAFRLDQRRVEFVRTGPAGFADESVRPGKLYLQVTGFSEVLRVLGDQGIAFELIHYDLGICRAAIVVDPGGNMVTLLEERGM